MGKFIGYLASRKDINIYSTLSLGRNLASSNWLAGNDTPLGGFASLLRNSKGKVIPRSEVLV
ncbi:unknown protein [Microcystis aeruginosa NIES-843]|uniref:Uncharacterized protein n=1 Tax=Microcystis aeruginosa (strain NIES-843 / IAM M-2473) TaxID=449447 RepID=B0JKD0_MICAN|nr:unknown protein [Microcystis aeruginosa NIES-843]